MFANENNNPDLYFALRGGGNNFGIVTSFLVRLVPQGQMLGGTTVHTANYTERLVDEVYELSTTLSNDTSMCFSSRYLYNQTDDRFYTAVTRAYSQPVLSPPVFNSLDQIPYESSTVRIDWMSAFAVEDISPHGSRLVSLDIQAPSR